MNKPKVYESKYFIHFHQCDPAGIVSFAESLVISHQAVEGLIQACGIGWKHWFEHPDLAFPIRYTDCNYFSPLIAGTQCTLCVSVSDLSRSTVNFMIAANSESGACFQSTTVHTAISRAQRKKSLIPPEFYTQLTPYISQ